MFGSWVLLTVPHGACPRAATVRQCDTRAVFAAEIIHSELVKSCLASITYLNLKYRRRRDRDMNRANTKNHVWREALSKILSLTPPPAFHLDVHSFYDHTPRARKIPLYALHSQKNDLTSLRILHEITPPGELPFPLYLGSVRNDIHTEALSHGIPSLIIEVWEGSHPTKEGELPPITEEYFRPIASKLVAAIAAIANPYCIKQTSQNYIISTPTEVERII